MPDALPRELSPKGGQDLHFLHSIQRQTYTHNLTRPLDRVWVAVWEHWRIFGRLGWWDTGGDSDVEIARQLMAHQFFLTEVCLFFEQSDPEIIQHTLKSVDGTWKNKNLLSASNPPSIQIRYHTSWQVLPANVMNLLLSYPGSGEASDWSLWSLLWHRWKCNGLCPGT